MAVTSPFSTSIRFYPGTVVVNEESIEIRRSLLSRIGGAGTTEIPVADIVDVVSEAPTAWLNGYTFFETRGASGHHAVPEGAPRREIFRHPHAVAFTGAQKKDQQRLLEAVEFARARLRGQDG
ncbi:hypothetical protein ACFY00_12085 [Kitasatospora sp. NPDC001540]|uniref:hypothetical protein n=1 Tax=Kitasatospora sp. NPDC001540 TaxID=3364014 RepID=UPI0036C6B7CB